MDLSKKILLTSCICAAFLAGAAGCMLEDQNLEEKGLFICMSDEECLEGSKCIRANPDKIEEPGKCIREEDIDHCHDYDGDGFYAADPGFDYQCGFNETNNRKDADDSNPMVNPDADEVCDGLDNDQDGCVDGSCAEAGKCDGEDKSMCLRLFRACVGGVSLNEVLKPNTDGSVNVCAPATIGGKFCVIGKDDNGKPTGKWEYRLYNPKGTATYAENGDITGTEVTFQGTTFTQCPTEDEVGYVYSETSPEFADRHLDQNNIDEDCDGKAVKASECVPPTETILCYIDKEQSDPVEVRSVPSFQQNRYNTILSEKCDKNTDNCGCLGIMGCPNGATGAPVCTRNGVAITRDYVDSMQKNGDTSANWNCYL